jgi:predicted NBD/HSP70 family sugar kinase
MARYISDRLNLDDLASSRPALQLFDRQGPLSQSDAARQLSLSAGACNLHFQRLEHEGLIRQVELIRAKRGRPRQVWDIAGSTNYCVTFVFDVPYFRASLIDFHGAVVADRREDLSSARRPDAVQRRMEDFLNEARQLVGRGKIRQVLVAAPGLLDDAGTIVSAVNFPVLNGLDLGALVRDQFQLPCFTTPLGLAYYYGETEHLPPQTGAMVIHWDLGVGVVFGRGRDVYSLDLPSHASHRLLWEVGHIRIVRDGRPCHCGRHGCLEAHTGGWVLMEALNGRRVERLSDLVRLVEQDDPDALRVTREAAALLGQHLTWPLQLMNAQRIMVTGPMAPAFKRVREAFDKGLGRLFSPAEVAAFAVEASSDPAARLQRGAYLLARRVFIYPDDYHTLPRTPAKL